ncbi:dTDP-4-amino-4,6-dideoxygalactose transaminase [Desulfotignum phosphitoxidans]|uniref:TDP-4-oxo-6-deoxy-D-glucose transaminase RffA n=1 Tax=Desulfotignum phosphitoxidans DSM 13687 TaxID=1286635 RepID=S0FWX6_9BACT|nr:dTDP-4-amino-4,6-dideoxygalactose transaminase [Desulfotignum phosphitoxidans]EMS77644.1 TDP-4-oxo-6-deoxy-D-glucose transaminase RffA [Desulfotignum phosphitoxidans DSM 13687]
MTIPFYKPYIAGKELYHIAQAVELGNISGDGHFTQKCCNLMETKFQANKVMLTHSCTAALEMAAILCDIQPGDEVIMPSFTFVSTANAFALRGATIRFADIRPDTLNLDEKLIEPLITEKTKAIVPVHYAGVGCDMDAIMAIADRYRLLVVEDAAQGVNSTYNGRYLGTIGHLGTYSFHETKNFISGEGGALVINDEQFIERAEIIRVRGTNRCAFFRGEVDHYTWVDVGSSYLMSDLLSAFLYAQLENMDQINQRRNDIWKFYHQALVPLANDGRLRLPYIPPCCDSNSHLFYIILPDEATRDALMGYLKERRIHAVFHYVPLHTSDVGLSTGYRPGQLPVTESMSGRLLRLPFYYELTREQQEGIVDTIFRFF